MLFLAWLLLSVPASLLLARAMTCSGDVRVAERQPVADWRREPAAA
ncbi:MAG: hypothetical protein QOK15_834 [Nocardioidaceae bacterium]|nr:hypothetical protein [Nocardioidaceae bacterium]